MAAGEKETVGVQVESFNLFNCPAARKQRGPNQNSIQGPPLPPRQPERPAHQSASSHSAALRVWPPRPLSRILAKRDSAPMRRLSRGARRRTKTALSEKMISNCSQRTQHWCLSDPILAHNSWKLVFILDFVSKVLILSLEFSFILYFGHNYCCVYLFNELVHILFNENVQSVTRRFRRGHLGD